MWSTDDARELREFLSKPTGAKLMEELRERIDALADTGRTFEEVALSSRESTGGRKVYRLIMERATFEEKPTVTSEYIDTSAV